MKIKYMIPLLALLVAGCSKESSTGEQSGNLIVLGIEGMAKQSASRAAIDEWDNTPVSVAFAKGSDLFTESFNVSVEANVIQTVNTGMAYPESNDPIHFVGYHPVAVPDDVSGMVNYDITEGNVDLMVTAPISGRYSVPFSASNPLVFKHKLTRITFELICKTDESYPEPVNGVVVRAKDGTSLHLNARLNLNTQTVSFSKSGTVFAIDPVGHEVPQTDPWIIDAMVQPGVPLAFSVQSLTGEKAINVGGGNDMSGIYHKLTNTGGDEGVQYIIRLQFSGVGILHQDIQVVNWNTGKTLNTGDTTWW